jgi:hypothetical protein
LKTGVAALIVFLKATAIKPRLEGKEDAMTKLASGFLVLSLLAGGSAIAQTQNPPPQTPAPQTLKDTPAPLVRQASPPTRQSQVEQMTTEGGTPIKINPKSKSARAK